MEFLGDWKVKKVMVYDDEAEVFNLKTLEEAAEADEDLLEEFSYTVRFTEDGFIYTLAAIPEDATEEDIEDAKADGALIIDNKFMSISEPGAWKEEDGKVFCNMGEEGTVFDEEVSPWTELAADDEGLLVFAAGLVRLGRAD